MTINNKYKNRFTLDGNSVHPVYSKNAAKVYEREDKRVFLREKLTGDLQFLRGDFDALDSQSLDHEFDIEIQRAVDGVYQPYIDGVFHKTDATNIDQDRKIWRTPIRSIDRYEKLLASFDKEYDVVRTLQPPLHTLNYIKSPLLQVAMDTHPNLYNLIGDTAYIKEIPQLIENDIEAYGFKSITNNSIGYIPGESDMTPDVSGIYINSGSFYLRDDGLYAIELINVGGDNVQWVIRGANASVGFGVKYRINEIAPLTVNMFEEDVDRSMFGSKVYESETTDSTCKFFLHKTYIRVLTDNATVLGQPTIALPAPEDDIGGHDFGYAYYVDPDANTDVTDFFCFPHDGHTTTPGQYGRFATDALHFAGEYFTAFVGGLFPGLKRHPILQLGWREYSLWGIIGPDLQDILDDAVDYKSCRNAYKLQDVIKYLLAEIDPTITFNADTTHCQFLNNANNPLTGDLNAYTHFITPKSNIVVGDYDSPATRGIIKFADIDQLLSNALNCHWWIDNNGLFKIEHIHYFKNGLSYTAQVVGHNLTVQKDPRLDKYWSYFTNNYRYRKETMPERYDFGWMDVTSDPFDGYPIEMLSQFVQLGNLEDKRIANFSSDIDYGQAFPGNMSKDGFFIMAASHDGTDWNVQLEQLVITGLDTITIQNGFWSMWYLHHKFHRHNLPCPDIKLNNQTTTATTVKRTKEQEFIIPGPVEPDPMRLVQTAIGVCEVVSMETNMETRASKITVLGDTT